MYEGNNPTAQRSQQWITQALLQMMQEKKYSGISVRDLCRRADLSRQTFYNLYSSKEDVLHAYLQSEVAAAYRTVTDRQEKEGSFGPEDMVDAFAKVLEDNRALLGVMIDQGLGSIISDEITNAVTLFAGRFARDTDPAELEYSVAFLSGGLARIMLCWAGQETPIPRARLTHILEKALRGELYRF